MTSRTVYLVRRIDSDPSKSAGYFSDNRRRSSWRQPNQHFNWNPRIFPTKRAANSFLSAWCAGKWYIEYWGDEPQGLTIKPGTDRSRSYYEIVPATLTLDLTP